MDDSLYKLQLIAFRNGKLFPATGNSTNLADDGKRRSVVTPVILTKIGVCAASGTLQSVATVALQPTVPQNADFYAF